MDIINCGRGLKSMIERGLIEGGEGYRAVNCSSSRTLETYCIEILEEISTPQKKIKKKPTPRVSVEANDDFDRGVVRRAIYGIWGKNVGHTEKIINDDWAREMKMDASETQPFIKQQ
uniref:Uncharacterized protein n=1 Tax=Timema poppense TaxID=170557 RepID=A0A7R9HE95_TIMPO|nr:unnamed protein product [Timema poppensis]